MKKILTEEKKRKDNISDNFLSSSACLCILIPDRPI